MQEMTEQFILKLKSNNRRCSSLYEVAAYSLSEITGTPMFCYEQSDIDRYARHAFQDYISSCNSPSYEIGRLFSYEARSDNITVAILTTLQLAQVRRNGRTINGFTEKRKAV